MSTALAAARAKTKGKRMLRSALDAYGEEDASLSKWNTRKKKAAEEGKWMWKGSVVSANAAIKARFDKDEVQTTLKTRFVDVQAAMGEEMSSTVHLDQHGGQLPGGSSDPHEDQCCWRERIGGKMYHCTNMLPVDKKRRSDLSSTTTDSTPGIIAGGKRFCLWHTNECAHNDHPMEKSRVVEIPNEHGMCLHCYDMTAGTLRATLQRVPPRVGAMKTPGVCETNARKEVKRGVLLKLRGGKASLVAEAGSKLGPTNVCTWQKEHSEVGYVWRCSNRVLVHPVCRGSYLSFCGFHVPRCVHGYGNKGKKEQACPLLDRRNRFGMCRNHLEAHLSTVPLEERGSVLLIDSDFDVPGIEECRKDEVVAHVERHPLAPKYPPPPLQLSNGSTISMEITTGVVVLPSRSSRTPLEKFIKEAHGILLNAIRKALDHPNPVSVVVKEFIWRVQFSRRADVVATRIQRIFRGKRARRRVRLLLYEQAAMDRIKACRVLQRFVRGFLGRRRFEHEHENVHQAVPHIQRLLRGALARKRFRELCAALRLQRNYRLYRQRLFARALREEIAYMQGLQRQADENYTEMEQQMITFRRLRARKVLRAHIIRRKRLQEMHEHEGVERLRSLLGTVKIQRQWRRYYRYKLIKKRYGSAQTIQKRVRGWLTRCMWFGDPGVHFIASFVNARSGLQYGKAVIESQPSKSYSYPSWKVRTRVGALTIQRVFRGHLGRLTANACWAEMLKRWEWLGITSTDSSGHLSDTMTVGHQRYGFVLPSFAYHKDRRQHMRPIANEPVSNRGHAYKYQYILDLIKDRNGERGWSLAREKMYGRQIREEQEWLRAEEVRREAAEAEVAMKALRKHVSTIRDPLAQAMPISKAIFPVGSIVDVTGKMEGKTIERRAKIIAIHRTQGGNRELISSVDVEYLKTLKNSFGRIEPDGEQHVKIARLHHIPLVSSKSSSKRNVGVLIQSAIDGLQRELQSSQNREDTYSPEENSGDAEVAVDGIADRLRDCRDGCNLLHDRRDFVNFVFRNSSLLRLKWLQVVSHIRYGTRSKQRSSVAKEPQPSTLMMEMFHREFGFIRGERTVRPMPERAQAIEDYMVRLGFEYNTDAGIDKESDIAEKKEALEDSTRPETTPIHREISTRPPATTTTVDDMMLFRDEPTPQSTQDMNRLIYELKTLPKEARREQIIHIASRRAHAYVCSHPACGKCFSSRKGARLHQTASHEGRERLASANPIVDQYFHSYWPQETPWTEAEQVRMVGYYGCSKAGCEKLQFRTRQELQRHHVNEHGTRGENYNPASSSPSQSPVVIEDEPSHRPTWSRSAIWLGPYIICRNLEAKLGIAAMALTSPKTCPAHDNPVELCTSCFLQKRRPAFPYRLYSAIAVRKTETGTIQHRIEVGTSPASQEEEYLIFRDDDDEFCPAVNIWGVYSLTTPPKYNKQESVFLSDPLSSVVFIKVSTICRDAMGEAWMFGYALAHRRLGSKEDGDEHEVVPDKARGLVFALLSHVVGAASIHYCSKSQFLRTYHSKVRDGATASGSSAEKNAKGSEFARNLFCRPSQPMALA